MTEVSLVELNKIYLFKPNATRTKGGPDLRRGEFVMVQEILDVSKSAMVNKFRDGQTLLVEFDELVITNQFEESDQIQASDHVSKNLNDNNHQQASNHVSNKFNANYHQSKSNSHDNQTNSYYPKRQTKYDSHANQQVNVWDARQILKDSYMFNIRTIRIASQIGDQSHVRQLALPFAYKEVRDDRQRNQYRYIDFNNEKDALAFYYICRLMKSDNIQPYNIHARFADTKLCRHYINNAGCEAFTYGKCRFAHECPKMYQQHQKYTNYEEETNGLYLTYPNKKWSDKLYPNVILWFFIPIQFTK